MAEALDLGRKQELQALQWAQLREVPEVVVMALHRPCCCCCCSLFQ